MRSGPRRRPREARHWAATSGRPHGPRGSLAMIGVEPDNAFWREPHLFVKRPRRKAPERLAADLDRPACPTSYGDLIPDVRRCCAGPTTATCTASVADHERAIRPGSGSTAPPSGWPTATSWPSMSSRAATASSRSRTSVLSPPISTSSAPEASHDD